MSYFKHMDDIGIGGNVSFEKHRMGTGEAFILVERCRSVLELKPGKEVSGPGWYLPVSLS